MGGDLKPMGMSVRVIGVDQVDDQYGCEMKTSASNCRQLLLVLEPMVEACGDQRWKRGMVD